MAFINWALKRGYISKKTKLENTDKIVLATEPSVSESIESLSLHFVAIGVAILLGVLFQKSLFFLASSFFSGKGQQLFMSFPLFPLCMFGGILVQMCLTHWNKTKYLKHKTILKIQNVALDFLIVAAIATIKVQVIAAMWIPLVILILAGVLWNMLCLILLARRVFKDAWFERAIAELGQSMGVTATGLLLLRVVDPNYETPAAEAFAGKQLFHEPFMGGGLWTSMAIPLLALWGGWTVFFISIAAIFFWSIIIFFIRVK
jgi:ESS family glutamate:Na+ symporter